MTGPSAPTPDPSAVPDRVASTETSAVHEARPSSWTTGPFPPLWAAVIGSLFVVATTGMGLAVTFVGSVVSAIVARRRPWVSATAVVLAVWSGMGVLLTGRF